jgi:hypothetical protein
MGNLLEPEDGIADQGSELLCTVKVGRLALDTEHTPVGMAICDIALRQGTAFRFLFALVSPHAQFVVQPLNKIVCSP